MADTSPKKNRDRDATSAAILAAARSVLLEEGLAGFGVNAVARRAGFDKQLIYRYFNGLDGLAEALGEALGRELAQALDDQTAAPTGAYADLMEQLLVALLRESRASPLVARLAAWESSDSAPLVQALTKGRSNALTAWMQRRRKGLPAPAGVDAPCINAVLIAAVQHLAAAAQAQGGFAGLALAQDKDWARLEKTLRALIHMAYREG